MNPADGGRQETLNSLVEKELRGRTFPNGLGAREMNETHETRNESGSTTVTRNYSCTPLGHSARPFLDETATAALKDLLHHSPRTLSQPTSWWTLALVAAVCHSRGWTPGHGPARPFASR